MSKPAHKADSQRAILAAKAIFDGRDPVRDMSQILVTMDHVVATILLMTMSGDHRKAIGMLHEGVVPHVEERIARHANSPRKATQ